MHLIQILLPRADNTGKPFGRDMFEDVKQELASRFEGVTAYLQAPVEGLAGVLMIARHALGGSLDVQAWVGFVGFGVLGCFGLAWYNIKKLQIEQHRAWMLRGWFYVRA